MIRLDLEQARFNMIEQQIRTWDVLDQRVLDVIARTPREEFVPERYRSLAFADINIPLGRDQVMMAPKVEGRLLQALGLQNTDTILEIGTGSGYLTACLARMGSHVDSLEIIPEFAAAARDVLAAHDIRNVSIQVQDAIHELDSSRRYDAIAVTGSLPVYLDAFHRLLADGGRLFVITGGPPIMEAQLVRRIGERNWSRESLFETSIPALLGAEEPQRFVF
jgi:protein-L-isoaspartate(D-aspartate) O-methyltransferase